jgi:hypothetical protein
MIWPACALSFPAILLVQFGGVVPANSFHVDVDVARGRRTDFGKEVEVHDGVKPGDQVILNPMVNLAEGSKVAARKAQTN